MMSLLVFKERLKEFYSRYDIYLMIVIKFLFSFITFNLLNSNLGFMAKLNRPVITITLSLLCSVLPYGATALIAAGFMIAHLSGVSIEVALIVLIFMMLIALLYYGFQPGDSYLLVLVPMMFFLKIPYVVPLVVGLACGPVCIIPVSCGIFIYYTILYMKQNASLLTGEASGDMLHRYMQVIKSLFSNKTMVVMIVAFAVCILVVYLIRRLSVDYAWVAAVIAGTIALLGVIFMGDITLEIQVPLGELLIGILLSIVIIMIYMFFVFLVDYSRTEYVQFEDDDYYYYVKAVPKLTVSTPDVKVKQINSRKSQRPQR